MFSQKPKPKSKDKCFCQSLGPILWVFRMFGLFPVTTKHTPACVFERSLLWIIYSFVIVTGVSLAMFYSREYLYPPGASILLVIFYVMDFAECCSAFLFMLHMCFTLPKWIGILNRLSMLSAKKNVLCAKARNVLYRINVFFVCLLFFVIGVSLGISAYFAPWDKLEFMLFVRKLLGNMYFSFFCLLMVLLSFLTCMMICFEKILKARLNAKKLSFAKKCHDDTSGNFEIFGLFSVKVCNDGDVPEKQKYFPFVSSIEEIDSLRILHEDICVLMYDFNKCLDPWLLVQLVLAILFMVLNWYSTVIYFLYDFKDKEISLFVHSYNCFQAIGMTLGLFLMLKTAQQLRNRIESLKLFLLEFSTRSPSTIEQQQIRLFILKLSNHRPLNASGVVNMDLDIAAPIIANIFTYVLVALQFNIPKE